MKLCRGSFLIVRNLMNCLVFLLALSVVAQNADAAAPAPDAQMAEPSPQVVAQAAKVKAEVQKHGAHKKSHVKVVLHDKTQHKGRITQIGDDSFSLMDDDTWHVNRIPYADVESVRRPGMSDKTKVRIAMGATAVIILSLTALASAYQKGPCCYGGF